MSIGEVAEWSIAAVLKTVELRGSRGSNPCLSAFFIDHIYWRDARVVEEARLESVCAPKVYREFESRSLRKEEFS